MLMKFKRQLFLFVFVIFTLILFHQLYDGLTKERNNGFIKILSKDIGRLFGTKSRYPNRDILSNSEPDINFKLRQIQLICRHGTRYPTGNNHFLDQLGNLTEFLYENKKIIPEQFEFLSSFNNPYSDDDYGLLVPQGIKDMQGLAKRAMKRYSSILDKIDDIKTVKTYSTNVTRVIDSALAFLTTLQVSIEEEQRRIKEGLPIPQPQSQSQSKTQSQSKSKSKEKSQTQSQPTKIINKAPDPFLYNNHRREDDSFNSNSFTPKNQSQNQNQNQNLQSKSISSSRDDENTSIKITKRKSSVLDTTEFNEGLEKIIDEYNDDFDYLKKNKLYDMIDIIENRENDWELSPHISCKLFNKTLNNDDRKEIDERVSQVENNYIKRVVSDAKEKLKLDDIPGIVGEGIMSMCIFEVALNDTRDQFCSLIKEDTFKYYNYFEDIRSYYIKGYGNPVNEWLATPLLKAIVDDIDSNIISYKKDNVNNNIKKRKEEENKKRTDIILRFAHAETIFPLTTILGLYKDDHQLLMEDGPPRNSYLFRSSDIGPFAANFWFELYECETKYIKNYKSEEDVDLEENEDAEMKMYSKNKNKYMNTNTDTNTNRKEMKSENENVNVNESTNTSENTKIEIETSTNKDYDTASYLNDFMKSKLIRRLKSKNTNKTKKKALPSKITYIVRVLLNENEVKIPNCQPVQIIDQKTKEIKTYTYFYLLSDFKKIYKTILLAPMNKYMDKCFS